MPSISSCPTCGARYKTAGMPAGKRGGHGRLQALPIRRRDQKGDGP